MDGAPLRVLLIEDDEDDYVLVRDFLKEALFSKFHLDWVQTYQAGLAGLCNNHHDVYLLDFRLADQNGLDLLREAVARGCEAPIIFLTGQGDYQIDLEAMKAGALDYLVKDRLSGDQLERSIRYAIERKRIEFQLVQHRAHLEELVRDRTAQLEASNQRLQKEIEERVSAEERIAAQNRFLTTVLDSLTHPFYVLDANDHSIKIANKTAVLQGVVPDSGELTSLHDDLRADQAADQSKRLQGVKELKQPSVTERIHFDANGNARTFESHSYPVVDADGNVVQIIEYNLDITKRKQMEEKLRAAQEELESRVKQRTMELARANEALRLNEYRLECLLKLNQMSRASTSEIADYVLEQQVRLTKSAIGAIGFLNEEETMVTVHAWPEQIARGCCASTLEGSAMQIPIEKAGPWAKTVRARKPMLLNNHAACTLYANAGPQCPVELSRFVSVPVFEGDRIVVVALVANKRTEYDATDMRQLTLFIDGMWKLIQRGRWEKALRQAESMAAIGRALSSVVHDMRTPLVAIGGFARRVQKRMAEENPDWEKLNIIIKETRRIETMLEDMLDFSRPPKLDTSKEDVNRVIEETLDVVTPLARKSKVEVLNRLASDLPLLSLDAQRIKRALINLVQNAIQASHKENSVEITSRCEGKKVIIDVLDHGSGIPIEKRNEIFEPFYTTKKDGTGLGLPIVKRIVEAHGGQVGILDNPGRGTIVRVVIPAAPVGEG